MQAFNDVPNAKTIFVASNTDSVYFFVFCHSFFLIDFFLVYLFLQYFTHAQPHNRSISSQRTCIRESNNFIVRPGEGMMGGRGGLRGGDYEFSAFPFS